MLFAGVLGRAVLMPVDPVPLRWNARLVAPAALTASSSRLAAASGPASALASLTPTAVVVVATPSSDGVDLLQSWRDLPRRDWLWQILLHSLCF